MGIFTKPLSVKGFCKNWKVCISFRLLFKKPQKDFNLERSAVLLKEVTSFDCFELHAIPYWHGSN